MKWFGSLAVANRSTVLAAVLLTVLLLLNSGCRTADPNGPRALTATEASRLAEALYLNHLQGRSLFEVNTVTERGGAMLHLRGTVDWSGKLGRALVSVEGTDHTLVEVAWSGDLVAERRPFFDSVLLSHGALQPVFILRPADPSLRIDNVIRVVKSLSSQDRENQLLLRRKEGTAYLRSDSLRDQTVDVIRYGQRTVYWINQSSGALLRFEGTDSEGGLQIIVDFFGPYDDDANFPSRQNLVEISSVPELWDVIRSF